ncbi:hypothetical protein UFOVP1623_51 [uncultured Caudovirales phage]|uniref:Bacteriophage Rz lysis protein n=1 Tax=uncultured Caudovirales phage TaxID=2100421 RepID=A0A6J5RZ04_9CAUD|nr:hypothetical protein UFOVP1376_12 [uncultured Caudovirales phage]CAB4220858.1 hypothetical protein UFOVP1623_51 [uncultured Caudovirales phage]
MPLFLLSPLFRYAAIALAVLGFLGAVYGVGRIHGATKANARWEAGMARQATVAAKLYSDKLAEIAALERDRETLNTRLSKEVADAREETADALGKFNAAVRLRVRTQGATANCPAGSPPTASARSGAELEATGIFVSREALEAAGALAAGADATEAVMKACRAWAISVGR